MSTDLPAVNLAVAAHCSSSMRARENLFVFGWTGSLLVREKVLLTNLCERKILFQLEIYNRFTPAEQAARTGTEDTHDVECA